MIIKHIHGPSLDEIFVNDVIEHQLSRDDLDSAIIAICEHVRKHAISGDISLEMLTTLLIPDEIGYPIILDDSSDGVVTESVYII
jgi:hypothetical protein